jgi:hypothetical protein
VTIKLSGSGVDSTATTDANGEYKFSMLMPGIYRVTEVNLPNYLDTGVLPGVGNAAIDLNNINAVLEAGEDSIENNFLDALPPPTECTPGCFNSADMWMMFDGSRRAVYDANGGVGAIFILSLNRAAVNDDEVLTALMGMDTAHDRLSAQFVAAQLNALSFPGSIFNRGSCFYLGPNVIIRIPGDPRLVELLAQARMIFATGTDFEVDQLAVYIEMFNQITSTRGILCPFVDP